MFSIGRTESTYVVPREHPAAGDVRFRADRVLRERVVEVLPPLVEAAFPGPAVCLVERLALDFVFAADTLDDAALAQLWSQEIARGLAAAIRKGENVIHFPNRAAFVAQYVTDVTAGRADRWYYASFDSLAALPSASAIREAIVREPAIAFDVVAELARTKRLRTVINALSDRGAREVWEAAFPTADPASDPSPALVELLLSVWEETVPSGIAPTADRDAIARVALRLATAVIENASAPINAGELQTHIEALLAFAAMLDGAAEPWSLVESIIDADAATAVIRAAARDRITDLATLRFFTHLAAMRADLVTCAASTLPSRFSAPATTAQAAAWAANAAAASKLGVAADEIVASRFAALALLLPPLIDLGLFAAGDEAALRALLAARCAGGKRAREVLTDPIVLLFAGGDAAMRLDQSLDFDAGLRDLTPRARREIHRNVARATHAVMKSLAARLPGFARSSLAHLRANFLAGEGAIRFDGERIDVYLPPLPLALVVRIAGMHGKGFAVPWLPDRVVTLLLPESS